MCFAFSTACEEPDKPIPETQETHDPSSANHLEIAFTLNTIGDIIPSYQTAIWLEGPDDQVVTLLVSEWLNYTGFYDERVCPAWLSRSNWKEKSLEEMDAVSAATPRRRPNTFRIDCKEAGLSSGTYQYYVQTHIEDEYNILARGTIEIGNLFTESTAQISHDPEPHAKAANTLTDVSARYYPE